MFLLSSTIWWCRKDTRTDKISRTCNVSIISVKAALNISTQAKEFVRRMQRHRFQMATLTYLMLRHSFDNQIANLNYTETFCMHIDMLSTITNGIYSYTRSAWWTMTISARLSDFNGSLSGPSGSNWQFPHGIIPLTITISRSLPTHRCCTPILNVHKEWMHEKSSILQSELTTMNVIPFRIKPADSEGKQQ